ncbi:MAG: hypothetical protein HY921_08220 [Elusimicrobia bacterium]|nr:hypothetical protein [Elusimicrobiota bacterium]
MKKTLLSIALSALFPLSLWSTNLIPEGNPPSDRASRVPANFAFSLELLPGYGFDSDAFRKLDPSEQERVKGWIRVLEFERREVRLARPELSLKGPVVAGPAAAAPVQNPGAVFDGGKPRESQDWNVSVDFRNLEPRRFVIANRDGLSFQGGYLGVAGRSPLIGVSPYFSVRQDIEGSNSWVDYAVQAQVGVVDLKSRLYYADNPSLDSRIDRTVDGLSGLDPRIGLRPQSIESLRDPIRFSMDFQGQNTVIGSVLAQVGRAYPIVGPLDAGWSAMLVGRYSGGFPNVVLDQSGALRVRLGEENYFGLFGGVTEAVGLFKENFATAALTQDKVKLPVHPDLAPHASVAFWGKMPYLSGARYSVEAGKQWNPMTTVQTVAASVVAPAGKEGHVGVQGRYSKEDGAAIEFHRKTVSAGVAYSPNRDLELSVNLQQDQIQLGNATVKNQGVFFGVTYTGNDPNSGTGHFDFLSGGKDKLIVPAHVQSEYVKDVQKVLARFIELKTQLEAVIGPGGLEARQNQLQGLYQGLPADVRQQLNDAYRAANPAGPSLEELMATPIPSLESINQLVTLLADAQVLERILVRHLRNAILEELSHAEVKFLGQKIKLNVPGLIAGAHAYRLGLSPLPGITEKDAREGVDVFLIKKFATSLGCKDGSTPEQVTQCLLQSLPEPTRNAILAAYGANVHELLKNNVTWMSDIIRREINATILQLFIASEQLQELTVDQGERPAALNARALGKSFARLDERRRAQALEVLGAAKSDVEESLERSREEVRQDLADYGQKRLSALMAEAAWPKNVEFSVRAGDWPSLLESYGDAQIFRLFLRLKAQLAQASGGAPVSLLLALDRDGIFASPMLQNGRPLVLTLPSRPVDLSGVAL